MVDQAHNLREFVRKGQRRARVLAVSSGKGGVGKTSTSVNLAIALSARGNRVVLLDADLGLANVEVLLGLNSLYNLQHVISGERTMTEILVQGPGGIMVVPGSSGIARLADLGPIARQNVLNGVEELEERADFIIVDTMAGISQNVIAFAAAADEVLIVCTPEPSSIVDAYATVKTIFNNREDAVIRLVVNMATSEQQAAAVSKKMTSVCLQYLGRNLTSLGFIPRDPHVSQSVMQTFPFLLRYPACPAAKSIEDLAGRVLQRRFNADEGRPGFLRRFVQTLGLASNA